MGGVHEGRSADCCSLGHIINAVAAAAAAAAAAANLISFEIYDFELFSQVYASFLFFFFCGLGCKYFVFKIFARRSKFLSFDELVLQQATGSCGGWALRHFKLSLLLLLWPLVCLAKYWLNLICERLCMSVCVCVLARH